MQARKFARPARSLLQTVCMVLAALVASAKEAPKPDIEATSASNPKDVATKVREALGTSILPNKKLIVNVSSGKAEPAHTAAEPATTGSAAHSPPALSAATLRVQQNRAKALSTHSTAAPHKPAADAKHSDTAHWAYEGVNGPQAWGQLKPEFNLCATGRRQSPISIEEAGTLQGPAEPIVFSYAASQGTVINNGHTIQVDVQGDNSITVRGSNYRLLQFHFHTPSEEQINHKRYPMVAHLVHRNVEGQLAVVAVLLDTSSASPLIDKVWTYMPLDTDDRVRMPPGLLDLKELLPTDQRYYQFMGSLTTPPCSEGVLWLVLKTPMAISQQQLRLFTQLYPNNARPIQPMNARPVRDAQ
jgi:carbonic anhydrase